MDMQAPAWPAQRTAKEFVREVYQVGKIVSVKTTIRSVRERSPYLLDIECQLVALIVDCATKRGLFVAFDVREP
ncbi:hypothetical protein X743_08730 [Mesorhizobium sp. LNHC252B00]|uniref:hypothetical protein n=1 Tax=Mesorhizobium sp. LNHC252B00 TaxID=1287252 RepID=UPI0003CE71C9|nr:hypothetical protein [Mesorhizobium sp. LNHC252B00]ESY73714.1 hypothetical protein X743_08730 [Mesorhizobium sp. LNHC252B00]